jgi:hypothetical protein
MQVFPRVEQPPPNATEATLNVAEAQDAAPDLAEAQEAAP